VVDESGRIIYRHSGLRADLHDIASEVGSATLLKPNF
jgi:hypothetical protein